MDLTSVKVATAGRAEEVGAPFDASDPQVLLGLLFPTQRLRKSHGQVVPSHAAAYGAMCPKWEAIGAVGEERRLCM